MLVLPAISGEITGSIALEVFRPRVLLRNNHRITRSLNLRKQCIATFTDLTNHQIIGRIRCQTTELCSWNRYILTRDRIGKISRLRENDFSCIRNTHYRPAESG